MDDRTPPVIADVAVPPASTDADGDDRERAQLEERLSSPASSSGRTSFTHAAADAAIVRREGRSMRAPASAERVRRAPQRRERALAIRRAAEARRRLLAPARERAGGARD